MLHRISLLAAVVIASLAVAVTPALAGEDDGNPATPPATGPTGPAAPAPAPTPTTPDYQRQIDRLNKEVKRLKREAGSESGSGGGGGGSTSASTTPSPTPTFTPVAQTTTVPQGGVQAGAGGTAQDDSGSVLPIGLGLIGLTAVAASGFALRRRYGTE